MSGLNLNQKITLWTTTAGGDGYGGGNFAAPVAILGRWEAKSILFRDNKGDEVVSKAVVAVDSDVAVGDYIFEGTSVETNPESLEGAEEVKRFDKALDLRSVSYTRRVYL